MAGFLETAGLLPTDEEVEQNRAHLERYADDALATFEKSLPPEYANLDTATINTWISDAAHDLVLAYEVGGEAGYRRKYKFPVRPPGDFRHHDRVRLRPWLSQQGAGRGSVVAAPAGRALRGAVPHGRGQG